MKVQVDVMMIESDDVANAIAKEVSKHKINKLVIGASPRGIFSRYLTCIKVKMKLIHKQ